MVQIGELATLITANTQPFERATKRASGATRSFAGDVDRTSQTLGGKFSSSLKKAGSLLAGPLGITASFAGVAAASKQAFSALKQEAEALDAIGKLSSRTGISTEDLTALEFIAGQTGASFDQVQRAVEAFQKRLGQAKMGTGEAAKVLEELNIDVDTFTRLPLVEQLMQISDRLAGMTTQADKAAVAAALFSRVGQGEMLNMLSMGRDSMEEMIETARRLGIVMGDDVVKALERTNDTFDRYQQRAKGLKRDLTAELIPAIGHALEELERLLPEDMRGGDKSFSRQFLDYGSMLLGGLGWRRAQRHLYGADEMKAQEEGKLLDAEMQRLRVRAGTGKYDQPRENTQRQQLTVQQQQLTVQQQQLAWVRQQSGFRPAQIHEF